MHQPGLFRPWFVPPPLLSPMFCCCTNALCPPFYLSALPAVSASAAKDSSVTGRLSARPGSRRCKSKLHALGTLTFVIFCLIVLPDCLHTASLWFFLHHCLFVQLMALQAITFEGQGREVCGHIHNLKLELVVLCHWMLSWQTPIMIQIISVEEVLVITSEGFFRDMLGCLLAFFSGGWAQDIWTTRGLFWMLKIQIYLKENRKLFYNLHC